MMKKLAYLLAYLYVCFLPTLQAQTKNALFPMPNAQGKWGYVDINNKLVIPHKFHDASPFYEERAFVAMKQANGQISCHAIDTKGTILFTIKFLENFIGKMHQMHIHHYADGLLNIPNYEGKAYRYVDKAGRTVFNFPHNAENYGNANNFSEGLAFVVLTDSTWGYIDTKGKLALQGKSFAPIECGFYQGWAVTSDTEKGLTYLNKKGEKATFLSQYALQDLGSRREGYALMALSPKDSTQQEPNYAVLQPDNTIKPIKLNLSHSTPVTYVSYWYFSHGLAYVRYYEGEGENTREHCGYLNTAGKLAFELPQALKDAKPDPAEGYIFHEGLACWSLNNYDENTLKIVYINTAGKIVMQSPVFKKTN